MREVVDMAQLVREIRSRVDLTQEQFAARLGVTFPTINRWENERTRPSPLAVRQLRDMLLRMGDGGRDLLERYFDGSES